MLTDALPVSCSTDMTMKRVVLGVLAMLILLPIFEVTTGLYGDAMALHLGGLRMLHQLALTEGQGVKGFQTALQVSS